MKLLRSSSLSLYTGYERYTRAGLCLDCVPLCGHSSIFCSTDLPSYCWFCPRNNYAHFITPVALLLPVASKHDLRNQPALWGLPADSELFSSFSTALDAKFSSFRWCILHSLSDVLHSKPSPARAVYSDSACLVLVTRCLRKLPLQTHYPCLTSVSSILYARSYLQKEQDSRRGRRGFQPVGEPFCRRRHHLNKDDTPLSKDAKTPEVTDPLRQKSVSGPNSLV